MWWIPWGWGLTEGFLGGAGLAAFAQAVGVTADAQDGGFVQEPVEGRGGHDGVAVEDVGPVAEGFVGGEHHGPAGVVTLADDLEEQRGLGLVQREVADLVDDEQFGPGEVSHFPVQAVFREGEGELAGQFDRAGEINPVAHLRTRASNWASAAAPAARTTNPFGSASSKVHRAGAVAPSLTSANCTADSFRRRPCKCAHFASVRRLMPSRRANCSIVRPLAR